MKARAYGHHLLVILPQNVKVTEGGIVLPDNSRQRFCYGRVHSVGRDVGALDDRSVDVGDIIMFDHLGHRQVALDPTRDEPFVVIHDTMIYAVLDESELVERKLPIPWAEGSLSQS